MRLAATILGALCLLALPSSSLAASATLEGQIGKPVPRQVLSDPVSEISYGRSDGPASQAELYFPAQLLPDGDRLLFSEYNSVLIPRYYKLGGALRQISASGEVDTLALTKKMARTADRMVGLTASDGIAYSTLGESVISLPLPDSQSTAERVLGFPSHGGIRETLAAYTLGSEDLPYDTLAGDPVRHGSRGGVGQEARFAYPSALSLYDNSLLVADRDNNALRRIDLIDNRSSYVLRGISRPVALAQIGDSLYIAGSGGVTRLDLASCADQGFSGCEGSRVAVRGGASALATNGQQLLVVSRSGIYAHDPISGEITRLARGSLSTRDAGGAAFWKGRLYISDFHTRVIQIYRLDLDRPVTARIRASVTADGTVLSAALTRSLPGNVSYSWNINAPGCQVTDRSGGKLVTCVTPRRGTVELSFSRPGYPERTVSRRVLFR